MTFAEMQTGVFTRLNKSLVPDAVTAARIQQFLNDRYRQLLREGGLSDSLRDETLQITAVPGQSRYALPASVTEIYNVTDTTNRIPLKQRSLAWIRGLDPSQPAQITGTPWVYAILNEAGITIQPTVFTASALQIVSTNAGDTMTGVLEYMGDPAIAGGFNTASFTLNGATPVVLAPAMFEVFRIQLASIPAGTVSLQQIGPPVVTLATMQGVLSTALHRWVIQLWPTPEGPFTYTVDFTRPRRPLVNPGDEPAIPEEFHTTLVYGACVEEALKMDDRRAASYEQQYQAGVKRFRAFLHQAKGQRWVPRSRSFGMSNIGGYFPANMGDWGTW